MINKDKSPVLSRRDFLKVSGAYLATIAPIPPVLRNLLRPEPKPSLPPTPDVWELSLAQRVELMGRPDFFTELQGENTKIILTNQFDDNEYIGMDRKVFRNNTCAQAVLTTLAKMGEYLNTGKVLNTTIADTYTALSEATFTDVKGYSAKYIAWNDAMYFVGIPGALELFVPQLVSKTEFLTPNYGARYSRIVPHSRWQDIFSKAQTVCEAGGAIIIGCLKYGAGHILLATNVKKDGTAIIVDSRLDTDGELGTAHKVLLEDYFEKAVDPEAKFLGEQPGLLHMIGVTLSQIPDLKFDK